MITMNITSWEREKTTYLLVETSAPRRNYSRIMEGGSNVDGDESGGTSPSRQGADTGILVPRSFLAMEEEIRIASRQKLFWNQGFRDASKIRDKGGHRGGHQESRRPPGAT